MFEKDRNKEILWYTSNKENNLTQPREETELQDKWCHGETKRWSALIIFRDF